MKFEQLTVENITRDRYARTADFIIEKDSKKKVVKLPNFAPRLESYKDIALIQKLTEKYPTEHLSSMVVRFADAYGYIVDNLNKIQTIDVFMQPIEDPFKEFIEKTLLIIDPGLEHLFYEPHLQDFNNNPLTPKIIKKYVKELKAIKRLRSKEYSAHKETMHRAFWNTLDEDNAERTKLTREMIEFQALNCNVPIIMPPVPYATTDKLVRLSISINRQTQQLASRLYHKKSALYFLINEKILTNEYIMDTIIKEISKTECPLIVFKIKNMDLNATGKSLEREAFLDLMSELDLLKRNAPNKVTMLLESGNQTFPAACYGFDIVSTSLYNHEGSGFGRSENGKGQYYNKDKMVNWSQIAIKKAVKNNDGKFPCNCGECKSHNFEEANSRWPDFRKGHHVLVRNEEMKEKARAVKEKNIELARTKLGNSDLSNLSSLVPRR